MTTFRILMYVLFFFCLMQEGHAQCYELVWADEFEYTGKPDSDKWTHEVNGNGGGNNELQFYTDRLKNSRVENGSLIIEAHKESYSDKAYTSARLVSYKKASFKYGKIEARIKLPYGQGMWPAFWMLGNSVFEGKGWPACGEIDIMEMVGGSNGDNEVHGTVHWAGPSGDHASYGGSKKLSTGIFHDDYHVFSVEWTDQYIKWFLDGIQYHEISITESHLSEFHDPGFIILNLAVGGNWPGSPDASTSFPQRMEVDYVRVFQKDAKPFIQGNKDLVKNQSNLKYSVFASGETTFSWIVPDGAEIVSGQGTGEVTLNWGCEEDTLKCNVTTECGTYTLELPLQISEPSISGETRIHAGQKNLIFSFPSVADGTYLWRFPEGVEIVKDNRNSVTVNWGSVGGKVKVEIQSSCGTDSAFLDVEAVLQAPYPDANVAHLIPGKVEAVHFDTGGEGIAYHDSDKGNNGPGIRQEEDVDTERGDGFGNIGWTEAGEWYEYSVDVAQSGIYDIEIRTAAQNVGGRFRLLMNGRDLAGEIDALSANSWTSYRTRYIRSVDLLKSDKTLRLEILNGLFNIASLNFIKVSGTSNAKHHSQNLRVFPNPVRSKLFIQDLEGNHDYVIHNLSGKTVQNGRINKNNPIDVSQLKSGIYFFKGYDHQKQMAYKFIKE